MPLSVLLVLGLVGLWLMLRGEAGVRAAATLPPVDGDGATLDALAHAGSNLSRVHTIEFFLYFPTQAAAEQAAAALRSEFTVEVRPPDDGSDWLCFATRAMRPELAPLRALRERFTALAEAGGGAYDGWGTEVEAEDAQS
jgi:regulator of RNase E activity RraB